MIHILLGLTLTVFAREYRDPLKEFRFEFDEELWEVSVDKKEEKNTLVNIQRKKSDQKYHARFSVVEEPLKKGQTLAEYSKEAIQFLKSQRFHILSEKNEKSYDIVANQRDFGLTFHQRILQRGQNAYLLTAAARTNRYEEMSKELDRFFETFQFTNTKTALP